MTPFYFLNIMTKSSTSSPHPQTKYDIRSGTPPQLGKAVGPLCPCHTHRDQWSVEKDILSLSLLPDNAAVANMGKSAATPPPQSLWLGELSSRLGVKIPFQGDKLMPALP